MVNGVNFSKKKFFASLDLIFLLVRILKFLFPPGFIPQTALLYKWPFSGNFRISDLNADNNCTFYKCKHFDKIEHIVNKRFPSLIYKLGNNIFVQGQQNLKL